MKTSKGFKQFNDEDKVLLLKGILYGLKQEAMGNWKELLKAHKQWEMIGVK